MKNNYCNNCGRQGHIYNNCNKPIISLGIIVFRNAKYISISNDL